MKSNNTRTQTIPISWESLMTYNQVLATTLSLHTDIQAITQHVKKKIPKAQANIKPLLGLCF